MRGPLSRRCVLSALLAGHLIAGAAAPAQGADAKEKPVGGTHRAQWFYEAKWGVFTHYLTGDRTTVEQWSKQVAAFGLKVCVVIYVLMLVRWTLPRFRYDQLMNFGWKFLLPLAFANIIVTAMVVMLLK